jgi:hypothetical protein
MTSLAAHPFLMGVLLGDEPETLLPLAQGAADWEEILGEATGHGLAPLLYGWLMRTNMRPQLPVPMATSLEEQVFGLAARNMMLANELGSILRAFEERHLPCAPLRGLDLAERLYGDITARPMGDLDLLVRKEDLPGVAATLRDLGYREIDRRPGFAQAFCNTLEFYKDRHGWIVVEPHWTIAYPPFVDRVDMEGVWRRCKKGRVVGADTWLLGPEDLLLHLCLHLTHRDAAAPLLWFYEIDRLVWREQEAFDWSQFVSTAREARVELLLAQTLGRVRALFGTPLPDRVLDQLATAPRTSVEGRFVRLLAGAPDVDGKESLAIFFTLKGVQTKLKYALALLFPSPEFMRLEYGVTSGAQVGLAYIRRFFYFIREGSRGIAKLFA